MEQETAVSVFKRIKANRLLINSTIFSASNVLIGFLSYIFHLIMARLLNVTEYGEFEALIALVALITIPSNTIVMVITRYSAKYMAKKEFGKLYYIFSKYTRKILYISYFLFLGFLILVPSISGFLKLNSHTPLIILSTLFITMPILSLIRGILQGLQKFWHLSLNTILELILKLLLAIALITLGFSLNGAVTAITANVIIVYFFGVWQIKKIFSKNNLNKQKITKKEGRSIMKFAFPVLLTMLFITLLFNIDLILVKHLFDPETAGMYSSLVVIGKIVFFATGAVSAVMFPMIAEAKEKNDNYFKIFLNAGILITGISIIFIMICFMMPEFIITTLLGNKFLEAAKYLGWYTILMLLMSLVNVGIFYFLSLKKTKSLHKIAIGPIIILILISIFHESIWEIITSLIIGMAVVLGIIINLLLKEKYHLEHKVS
jgi:O-antigen/teichoic acid export membrane protein